MQIRNFNLVVPIVSRQRCLMMPDKELTRVKAIAVAPHGQVRHAHVFNRKEQNAPADHSSTPASRPAEAARRPVGRGSARGGCAAPEAPAAHRPH
jgi:hypothetical protein